MKAETLALLGISAAGLGLLAFARKKPPPGGGASISGITIRDAVTGEPVPKNSPALVVEGGSYIASFTVTNLSTRIGAPSPADLTIAITGVAGLWPISFPAPWIWNAGPGNSVSWDITFTVPSGSGGWTGDVTVTVRDPSGIQLAIATEPLTISPAVTVYEASVTPIGIR